MRSTTALGLALIGGALYVRHRQAGMGGLGAEQTTAAATADLKKSIKKIAIESASASAGLQIGLMFAGPIGWAASAVISLVQFFTGRHYTASIKLLIQHTATHIQTRAAAAKAEVQAATSAVYEQEFPNAERVAVSSLPLDGFFSDVAHAVSKAAGAVTGGVVHATQQVTSAVATGVAKTVANTGNKALASKMMGVVDKVNGIYATAEGYAKKGPDGAIKLLTGQEMYDLAVTKATALEQAAFKQIDDEKAAALAKINTQAYHLQVITETAKLLRANPEQLAEAKAVIAAENAAIAAQIAPAQAALNNAVPSAATPAIIGAGILGVTALFWMKK